MAVESVETPDDPRLADYRGVRDRAWLRERDWIVAEGRSVLEIVLDSPSLVPESVLLTRQAYAQLEHRLRHLPQLRVLLASRALMRETSGVPFHQGCVALVRAPAPTPVSALLRTCRREGARVLVVEDVTDPDNVGGLFRNALAFGVSGVVLSPRCTSPFYRKAIRTSLGATLRIPFAQASDWPQPLELLRELGYRSVALTPAGSARSIDALSTELDGPQATALCVGNEGTGLSGAALAGCPLHLRIPMAPGADSLNVATAAAIALHEVFRRGASTESGADRPRDPDVRGRMGVE